MIVDSIVSKILHFLKLKIMAWYDLTAVEYAISDEKNPKANLDIKNLVKSLTSLQKPACVLDLACGTGRYFSFINGETVIGVDLSTEMLKIAKNHKKVELIRADIYHLPFRKETYDFILSMSVIGEHCHFDLELLTGICSVLRSKGTFIFSVIPLHHLLLPTKRYLMFFLPLQIFNIIRRGHSLFHFGASKFEIINKLRKLGFEHIQIKERHGSSYPHYVVVAFRFPFSVVKK